MNNYFYDTFTYLIGLLVGTFVEIVFYNILKERTGTFYFIGSMVQILLISLSIYLTRSVLPDNTFFIMGFLTMQTIYIKKLFDYFIIKDN